jgi:hypothetical protein
VEQVERRLERANQEHRHRDAAVANVTPSIRPILLSN